MEPTDSAVLSDVLMSIVAPNKAASTIRLRQSLANLTVVTNGNTIVRLMKMHILCKQQQPKKS